METLYITKIPKKLRRVSFFDLPNKQRSFIATRPSFPITATMKAPRTAPNTPPLLIPTTWFTRPTASVKRPVEATCTPPRTTDPTTKERVTAFVKRAASSGGEGLRGL